MKKRSTRVKKIRRYEVYSPMPYCEVYLVEASSAKEARRLFDKAPDKFTCIGEVSSRRKKVIFLPD